MHLPADFDPSVPEKKRGALRSVLGGENVQSDWESHGSATSLSFNCDNTRLLVGHAKGQVGGAPLTGGRGTHYLQDVQVYICLCPSPAPPTSWSSGM